MKYCYCKEYFMKYLFITVFFLAFYWKLVDAQIIFPSLDQVEREKGQFVLDRNIHRRK